MISPCSGASLGLYVFLDTFSSPTTPVSFKRWHSKLSRTYLAGDPDSSGGDAKPNRTELKRLEISPPTKTRKSPHHASYAHSPVANSEKGSQTPRGTERESHQNKTATLNSTCEKFSLPNSRTQELTAIHILQKFTEPPPPTSTLSLSLSSTHMLPRRKNYIKSDKNLIFFPSNTHKMMIPSSLAPTQIPQSSTKLTPNPPHLLRSNSLQTPTPILFPILPTNQPTHLPTLKSLPSPSFPSPFHH